ncbi:hypothetical protein [Acinetobacter colistiniresistens]|uniref:hypothetical protein n=1 Tax=Acinetobacter colistiniresistens TaxID=280145 RepID=UPI00124F852C|nr:hypothetical protein [Acinetobacter colistiniresistens]
MQTYSPISIGNMSTTFHDFRLRHVIAIARLPEKQHERKITEFLKSVLNDDALPLRLYAQQRHYLMMKYQQLQQGTFNFNIEFDKYEKNGEWAEKVEVDGYVFRQLNGFECEALEQYALENSNDYLDWFFGAMALQVGNGKEIVMIDPCPETNFAKRIIESRINLIKDFALAEGEKLIDSFAVANEQLNHLIDISFDNEGIVCMQQGGTDDAPIRFRPLSTVPKSIKDLLGGLSTQS